MGPFPIGGIMSDPRPKCTGCGKNDQVFPDDVKRGAPRHWRCLRCNLAIRKPRL